MKLGWRHWVVSVTLETAVHAALVAMFLTSERPSGNAKAGHGAIEISLSVAAPMATAEAVTAIEPAPAIEAEAVEEAKVEPEVAKARPIEPIEAVSEIIAVESLTEFVAVAATKPPVRAVSQAPAESVRAAMPPVTASPAPSSGTANPVNGQRDDYFSYLRAWLERHKKYPRNARLRRQEGTVTVRFTVQPISFYLR